MLVVSLLVKAVYCAVYKCDAGKVFLLTRISDAVISVVCFADLRVVSVPVNAFAVVFAVAVDMEAVLCAYRLV